MRNLDTEHLALYGEPHPRLCELSGCRLCDLSPSVNPDAHQVVLPYGNVETAFLAVIGQSPGPTEAQLGRPFSGPYFSLVRDLMALGLTFDDFVLSNSLWCHPPYNAKATSIQLKHCRNNSDVLFRLMPNLKLMLLVGGDALRMVEGDEARLDLRDGNLGYWVWRTQDHRYSRGFHTFPIYHPARIDKFENPRGKTRLRQEYNFRLSTLKELIRLVRSGRNLKVPYQYKACWTRDECYAALEQLKSLKPYRIAIDFETWALDYKKVPVGVAISYEPYKAFYFPLTQAVELLDTDNPQVVLNPDSKYKYIRKGKHKDYALVTHGARGWFYDGWDREFMKSLGAWLESPDRPFISAQHAQIEMSCCAAYGINLQPHPDQQAAGVCFDTMVMARGVTTGNRVNLETILQQAMPLEVYNKGLIQEFLTHEQISTTGFALMSLNPSNDNVDFDWLNHRVRADQSQLSDREKELVAKYCLPEIKMTKTELLAARAMFDSDVEFRLCEILPQVGRDMRFMPFEIDLLDNGDDD